MTMVTHVCMLNKKNTSNSSWITVKFKQQNKELTIDNVITDKALQKNTHKPHKSVLHVFVLHETDFKLYPINKVNMENHETPLTYPTLTASIRAIERDKTWYKTKQNFLLCSNLMQNPLYSAKKKCKIHYAN